MKSCRAFTFFSSTRTAAAFALAAAGIAVSRTASAQISAMGAGECRQATPAEAAAITKAIDAAKAALQPAIDAGMWVPTRSEEARPSVAVAPQNKAPIDLCSDLVRRDLALSAESPRVPALDSAMEAIQTAMQTDTSTSGMMKNMVKMAEVVGQRALSIRVIANNTNLYYDGPGTVQRLAVPPGAGFALRQVPSRDAQEKRYTTEIYVGNFAGAAQAAAAHKTTAYPFKHPMKSPFIENVVVRLEGAPATMDEFIRHVDWAKMAAGFTP